MRIGINARLLLKNRLEGIGWHAYEIIHRWIKAHPEHEFILYYDRKEGTLIPGEKNVKTVILYPPSRHPLLVWWWCKNLSQSCRNEKLDFFYSPEVIMPSDLEIPVLITIHDLSPIVLPGSLPWAHRKFYQRMIPAFARNSGHIITVSHFSKSEIVRKLKINPSKISVVYNAARTGFQPLSEELKQSVRNRYTHGCPYLIYLGSIHQRKNIDQIIKAFYCFKQDIQSNHCLVLAGKFMGSSRKVNKAIRESPYSKQILSMGYVAESDLPSLLGAADVHINLSEYEGFGMPLVEAFQAGVPVIAANKSCYPEIAGTAALLVDPMDLNQIVKAITQALTNSKELSSLGIERAKKFDWEKSADEAWNVINWVQDKSHTLY